MANTRPPVFKVAHKPTGFEGKTLWDKLNLFGTLAIPLIIALATIGFGLLQLQLADTQHQQDQGSALDQQHATILQTYIDNIQDLLLNRNLLKSKPTDDVAVLARARTLTALAGLVSLRRASLLQFLYEARLIGSADLHGKMYVSIIDLTAANLSNASLARADLSGGDLSNADLFGADLSKADLSEANLSIALLSYADLRGADLRYAYLSNATLFRAYLSNADLRYADLSKANLNGAILSNANLLTSIGLTQQQLDQVFTCAGALLPKGLICHHNS